MQQEDPTNKCVEDLFRVRRKREQALQSFEDFLILYYS